jgi:putative membrane protein
VSEISAQPRRLHPATLLVRFVKIVPQMLGGGVAYGLATAREAPGRLLAIVLAAAGIGVGLALLGWWRFRYTVGEDEIVIESGILRRQRRVIPYGRVQDVAIERRLLARLFGTARARIETGGSASDEGDLDMIALEDAQALRDRLRRVPVVQGGEREAAESMTGEALAKAGGGGPLALVEEPTLFALTFSRLLYSGLFNFSLLFLAAIFAVLQNLDQWGLFDLSALLTPKRTEEAAGYFNLSFTLILVPIVVALGLLSGVLRTVSKEFGFRLTRAPAGLRRRRGLLTLSEVVIPLRRTQVAVIESGAVRRRLGWHALAFETLGADRKEGGVQVAAPFARMDEILPILAEAGFPAPPPADAFVRPPARALWRLVAAYAPVAVICAAVALTLEPWAVVGVAAMAALSLRGLLAWRAQGHAIDGEALYVARGAFTRRVSIIPFERTQAIRVSRGPLQRRLALSTLLVDTAGAPLVRAPEIIDLDGRAADGLADRLLECFYVARRRVIASRPLSA